MIIKQQFCKIIMNNQSLDKRTTNMLIRQYILFVSLHLTFLFGTIYCTSSLCSYNSPWLIYTNQKLNQAPLEIITGQTALGCSNACFLDDKCTSFNHEPSTGGCELLRGARFKILGDEKQTTTGWNYYLINCQFIVTHEVSIQPGCSHICEIKGVWKGFMSAEGPGGNGDFETVGMWERKAVTENNTALAAQYCDDELAPLAVRARNVDTHEPPEAEMAIGRIFYRYSAYSGFGCRLVDNPSLACESYEVQWLCPRL
ncbi:unnamed protein product [Owenia fusiformis]|uniref:Apple domain-containing protein n=1 Tax=Owenia fusiformis TaxID=6347 RepID=A0A8S4PBW1_OWEFU|nr:unnamed protein product [Owenia fusiformis]